MSYHVTVQVFLHDSTGNSFEAALAPIQPFAEKGARIKSEPDSVHILLHAHLEEEDVRTLQSWIRSLPAQVPAGHAELDCGAEEPTKFLWSDVFTHREGMGQAFKEGLSMFLGEAHQFFHI